MFLLDTSIPTGCGDACRGNELDLINHCLIAVGKLRTRQVLNKIMIHQELHENNTYPDKLIMFSAIHFSSTVRHSFPSFLTKFSPSRKNAAGISKNCFQSLGKTILKHAVPG